MTVVVMVMVDNSEMKAMVPDLLYLRSGRFTAIPR